MVVVVPGVSELGGMSLGWGVFTMVLYHCLGATLQQQCGTWFLLVDAGGFCGGGSCFCACGHPFVLVLGHLLLSGQSWIVVGLGHCVGIVCGRGSVVSVLPSVVVMLSCGLLVGQALSAHRSTMMNNGFESTVCHLVAMLLSATWHLGWMCVSKGRTGGITYCAW